MGGGHYKVVWPHTKKKQFTSRLMYRLLTFGGVVDSDMQGIWRSKVPLKIKHFVYHVGRGRIPCAFQLVKRNWKGGENKCKLCGVSETVNHVLFNCPIAKFTWCVVKEVLHFPAIPVSFWEGLDLLKQKLGGKLGVVVFASWIWVFG